MVQNHNQKLNLLVCTCFSMMSFVFAPAAKNKPNLQNVFTLMTLSMTPLPNNLGLYICLLTFVFVLFVFVFVCLFVFMLGFSIRCETTVTWDFAKVTKMAHGGKTFFLLSYISMTNRETWFARNTLDIKTPMQLTTLNVKGAACDLFDVSMGINHGKFTSGNIGHTH